MVAWTDGSVTVVVGCFGPMELTQWYNWLLRNARGWNQHKGVKLVVENAHNRFDSEVGDGRDILSVEMLVLFIYIYLMLYIGCIVTVLVVMLEFGARQMHIGGAKGKRRGGGVGSK